MFRYLKFIFLVFGSIALAVASFFAYNNRHDISLALDYKEKLSYDYVSENCPGALNKYYYPCFLATFKEFAKKASLTGVSIGLKFAFNFLEEDQEKTSLLSLSERAHLYTLNHIEINNVALENAHGKHYGFKFLYGGLISRLRDFHEKAFAFSLNLIGGLRSDKGLKLTQDLDLRKRLSLRLDLLEKDFLRIKSLASTFVNNEVNRLTALSGEEK